MLLFSCDTVAQSLNYKSYECWMWTSQPGCPQLGSFQMEKAQHLKKERGGGC